MPYDDSYITLPARVTQELEQVMHVATRTMLLRLNQVNPRFTKLHLGPEHAVYAMLEVPGTACFDLFQKLQVDPQVAWRVLVDITQQPAKKLNRLRDNIDDFFSMYGIDDDANELQLLLYLLTYKDTRFNGFLQYVGLSADGIRSAAGQPLIPVE